MNYVEFHAGDKDYRLKLSTRSTVSLEKQLGCNPVAIFGSGDTIPAGTGETVPSETGDAAIGEGEITRTLLVKYLSEESATIEKLFENPKLIKTPVVRNGKSATVGYKPEVWKLWE